jgi:hypothetical protein
MKGEEAELSPSILDLVSLYSLWLRLFPVPYQEAAMKILQWVDVS